MGERKVLIVDDEDFVRKLIAVKLRRFGVDSIESDNGIDAIEKAISEKPDLILLDVMMPKMNGFDACQRLKANQETSHIPIVMLTSKTDLSGRPWGEQTGALEYFSKPFLPQKLAERVVKILNHVEIGSHP